MPFIIGIIKTVGQWLIPYVVQEVVKNYFESKKKKDEPTKKDENEDKKEG